jgi:hypothetical protein
MRSRAGNPAATPTASRNQRAERTAIVDAAPAGVDAAANGTTSNRSFAFRMP